MRRRVSILAVAAVVSACQAGPTSTEIDADNPIRAAAPAPFGMEEFFADEVAHHAPYMHDGSLATLRDVVEFYNRGGVANPGRSGRLGPLSLTSQEIDAVVAFLPALDGEGYRDQPPRYFPQ